MRKITTDLAASHNCGTKRPYNRDIEVFTRNAGKVTLQVSPIASFDGRKWHVQDDEVRITISDIGEADEESGVWEGNTDIMDMERGVAWLTFTPQQARQLARKLIRMADKCRTAAEVDRTDPELIESCAECEAQLRKLWAAEETD